MTGDDSTCLHDVFRVPWRLTKGKGSVRLDECECLLATSHDLRSQRLIHGCMTPTLGVSEGKQIAVRDAGEVLGGSEDVVVNGEGGSQ